MESSHTGDAKGCSHRLREFDLTNSRVQERKMFIEMLENLDNPPSYEVIANNHTSQLVSKPLIRVVNILDSLRIVICNYGS